MGCLDVSARCLNSPIFISAWGLKELEVSTFSSAPEMKLKVSALNRELKISCGMVCSVGGGYYLRVNPDTVWLSTDELASATFDIYSNDSWKITNEDFDVPYLDVSKNQVWVSMGEYDLFNIFPNVDWNID